MKQDKTILAITGAITGFGLGVLASYVLLNKKKHKKVSNTQHRRRFPSFFRRFSHRKIESIPGTRPHRNTHVFVKVG